MGELVKSVIERTTIWTFIATVAVFIVALGAVVSSQDAMIAGILVLLCVGLGRAGTNMVMDK